MKNSKKMLLITLLSYFLTLALGIKAYAYSLIIENDYKGIFAEQGKYRGHKLSLNLKDKVDPNKAKVKYSRSNNPTRGKEIFSVRDLTKLSKPGIQTTVIDINHKPLEVTYVAHIKYAEEKKKHKKKGLKNKIKRTVKKLQTKMFGKKITDIYVHILNAKLNGVELEKVKK